MAELPARKRILNAELMRALAHPLRAALLNYLMAVGPRTASECAGAVDSSASNCSWHLRQLAEFGLVERVDGGDGRERPWRATEVGLQLEEPSRVEGPAAKSAQDALIHTQIQHDEVLTQRFLDTREGLEPDWLDASGMNLYGLRLTPAELHELVEQVDALIRPYVATIRTDAPPEARPVHASLRTFLRIEADGKPSE